MGMKADRLSSHARVLLAASRSRADAAAMLRSVVVVLGNTLGVSTLFAPMAVGLLVLGGTSSPGAANSTKMEVHWPPPPPRGPTMWLELPGLVLPIVAMLLVAFTSVASMMWLVDASTERSRASFSELIFSCRAPCSRRSVVVRAALTILLDASIVFGVLGCLVSFLRIAATAMTHIVTTVHSKVHWAPWHDVVVYSAMCIAIALLSVRRRWYQDTVQGAALALVLITATVAFLFTAAILLRTEHCASCVSNTASFNPGLWFSTRAGASDMAEAVTLFIGLFTAHYTVGWIAAEYFSDAEEESKPERFRQMLASLTIAAFVAALINSIFALGCLWTFSVEDIVRLDGLALFPADLHCGCFSVSNHTANTTVWAGSGRLDSRDAALAVCVAARSGGFSANGTAWVSLQPACDNAPPSRVAAIGLATAARLLMILHIILVSPVFVVGGRRASNRMRATFLQAWRRCVAMGGGTPLLIDPNEGVNGPPVDRDGNEGDLQQSVLDIMSVGLLAAAFITATIIAFVDPDHPVDECAPETHDGPAHVRTSTIFGFSSAVSGPIVSMVGPGIVRARSLWNQGHRMRRRCRTVASLALAFTYSAAGVALIAFGAYSWSEQHKHDAG